MESRLKEQSSHISQLSNELEALLVNSDIKELAAENKKLTYQIQILQHSIEEEKANLKPLQGI